MIIKENLLLKSVTKNAETQEEILFFRWLCYSKSAGT